MESPHELARRALARAASNVLTVTDPIAQDARTLIPRVRSMLLHLRGLVTLIEGNIDLRRAALEIEADYQDKVQRLLERRGQVWRSLQGLVDELRELSPDVFQPLPESSPGYNRMHSMDRVAGALRTALQGMETRDDWDEMVRPTDDRLVSAFQETVAVLVEEGALTSDQARRFQERATALAPEERRIFSGHAAGVGQPPWLQVAASDPFPGLHQPRALGPDGCAEHRPPDRREVRPRPLSLRTVERRAEAPRYRSFPDLGC